MQADTVDECIVSLITGNQYLTEMWMMNRDQLLGSIYRPFHSGAAPSHKGGWDPLWCRAAAEAMLAVSHQPPNHAPTEQEHSIVHLMS